MVIETKLLDLEKEYNIHGVLRKNIDTLGLFLSIFLLLAVGYQSPIFLAPFLILLMLYVVMDENYVQTKDRNDIRLNHTLKQNNFFELVQANANDMMDRYEWIKNAQDHKRMLDEEYDNRKLFTQ